MGDTGASTGTTGSACGEAVDTTMTVMLSRPPAALAASTNACAASCGVVQRSSTFAISASEISSTKPSLHNTYQAPTVTGNVFASTLTSASIPNARVTMLRRG